MVDMLYYLAYIRLVKLIATTVKKANDKSKLLGGTGEVKPKEQNKKKMVDVKPAPAKSVVLPASKPAVVIPKAIPVNYLFTSESVTEGHPDKLCDQVSDAILDAIIEKDPAARVAVECMVTNGVLTVAGEITTSTYVEIPKIARAVIKDIGYTDSRFGFHYETSGIQVAIQQQSDDIQRAVDRYVQDAKGKIVSEDLEHLGAGDQGLMFGFACTETDELMPLPIILAHKLCKKLADVRKKGIVKGLRPDGKSQVTVEYVNGKPKRVHTVLIAAQHDDGIDQVKLKEQLTRHVIEKVIPQKLLDKKTLIYINSSGKFVIGGPQADTGLTGRKIIVDTYGGYARHGGGALSGKDATKVDRSGVYMTRYVAKNLVASGIVKKCEVQVAYAIGKPEPLSISVESFGTSKYDNVELAEIVKNVFDLRPGSIIKQLGLRRPMYRQLAAYGHLGRTDIRLPWERTDKTKQILEAVKKLPKK